MVLTTTRKEREKSKGGAKGLERERERKRQRLFFCFLLDMTDLAFIFRYFFVCGKVDSTVFLLRHLTVLSFFGRAATKQNFGESQETRATTRTASHIELFHLL